MIQPDLQQPAAVTQLFRRWHWLGPLLFGLLIGVYFVSRYGGRWAEADSTTFTNVIRPVAETGRLVSAEAGGAIYPNGYAFQAISTMIMALTGLEVAPLQQLVYPLLACLVALPAWALYRELIGSARAATISAMLLLTQPEFLFVILRSSHEKFTRIFMLLCLLLLVRSFSLRDRPRLLAVHIGLFYLLVFALIASNNLLAHSFIVAIAVAIILGAAWLLMKRAEPSWGYILQRLCYAILISLGLVYIFTFYIYSPALHDIAVMRNLLDRIAALFLDVQTTGGQNVTNAYAQVSDAWISLPVYFLVSIANWIILLASVCIWAWQGVRWLWRGEAPPTQGAWLLWLFYTAFAAQGALSIIADASGALSSNLQHRLFPSFAMLAAVMVGSVLSQWQPRRFAVPLRAGLAAAIACIAILSVFKATNEPVLSNKWTFYRSTELAAMDWIDARMNDARIWTEFDERLSVAFLNARGQSPRRNEMVGYLEPGTRLMLDSPVTRLRSSRLRQSLPIPPDAFRIYDNGEAALYRLRPQTPYQR